MLYKTFFDHNVGASYVLDKEGSIVEVNNEVTHLSGYSREELLKMKFTELVSVEDHSSILNCFQDAVNGQSFSFEMELITKQQERRTLRVTAIPYRIDKVVSNVIGIALDITDYVEQKQQFQESLEHIKTLVELSPDGIILYKGGDIVYSSKKALEIFETDKIQMQDFYEFLQVKDQLRLRLIVDSIKKRGSQQHFEFHILTKKGTAKVLEVSLSTLINDDSIILVLFRDITERKNTEISLKHTMKRLRELNFALNESSIVEVVNPEGYIMDVNDKFCSITKYSREELIGKRSSILNSGYQTNCFYEDIWRTLQERKVWHGELKNRAKDGTYYWVDSTFVPLVNYGNDIYQYVAIQHDITARKRAEEQLEKELELATKVQKAVLPKPISNDDISIDGYYLPSHILSGDMYSWYSIDEHRYGVIILDCMGHGVSASLISMSIRSLLRGLITRVVDPIDVATEINNHVFNLYNRVSLSTYLTLVYMVIDTKNKIIEYINCGHPNPILANIETREIKEITEGTIPLGLKASLLLEKSSFAYSPGSRIFLYSDGIIDIDLEDQSILSQLKLDLPKYSNDQDLLFEISNKITVQQDRPDDICLLSMTLR